MPKKSVKKKEKKEDQKVFAWIACFFTIIGFIIAIILWRDDDYIMFYAKQGLVLGIVMIIASVLFFIPLIGQLFYVFMIILWILAWINSFSGEKKNSFIVGDLAEKINL